MKHAFMENTYFIRFLLINVYIIGSYSFHRFMSTPSHHHQVCQNKKPLKTSDPVKSIKIFSVKF